MKLHEAIRPALTPNNYRDNSLYPWKADWEMSDEEYEQQIRDLKRHKKIPDAELRKLYKQKFSSYAMKKDAFKSKHWVRVYKNPEYKYD
jgi:hypothetical protein